MILEYLINGKQLESFANLFSGYSVNSKAAMDSSQILRGRPYGGVAIIFPYSLGSSAIFIDSKYDRLCVLRLHVHSRRESLNTKTIVQLIGEIICMCTTKS